MTFKQLSFSQLVPERQEWQEFIWGENDLLQFHLNKLLNSQEDNKFVYIWGKGGCGKTHLLQSICMRYESSIYLPLNLWEMLEPKSLENLEQQALISIDDIHLIAQKKEWEEELFHLFNRSKDKKDSILIISGQQPVHQLGLLLPDLSSRLQWGLNWHLKEPKDEDKLHILIQTAHKKGFHLSKTVAQYLLSHYNRNLSHLMQILNILDHASLEAQRHHISIPFIKEVLKPLPCEPSPI